MTAGRVLVLDENMPARLATELKKRGRRATRVTEMQLRGTSDPELLRICAERFDDWILLSNDRKLPDDHADVVGEVHATIAVVAQPQRGWHVDAWRREVVHRWAHAMQDQDAGTVMRYSVTRRSRWRPRRGR